MIALDPSLLNFNGTRFNAVELESEFFLRADEIGVAVALEPPEESVLALCETHADQWSERLSALAGVETPTGPRLMRVFNLLGAYVLATFVRTPEARQFRRWVLQTLIFLQFDVRRELRRMSEELRALRAGVEALKEALRRKDTSPARPNPEDIEAEFRRVFEEHTALLRAVAEDVRALRAAQAGQSRDALDAEFRRVLDERTSLLLGLAEDVQALRGSWAGGPAKFVALLDRATEQLRDLLDDPAARALGWELPGLAKAVAGLRRRLDTLNPARRDLAKASRAARTVPGVPAPAVPDLQILRFAWRDEAAVWGVLFAGDATPWLSAADVGRLAGLSETRVASCGPEVERLVPAEHRTRLEDGTLLVDPVGVDTLLFHWGDVLDEGQTELRAWLAGEVVPALHAAMLKQVQAHPEAHPGFPGAPTEVVADEAGLFKVFAGELDGHPCRLVNARDLHKQLKAGWKAFADWFRERDRAFGWREGRDYRLVYVRVGQYDPYLSLDAALQLLALETSPAKAAAQAYLQRVALGQPATIEGEAVRVGEKEASVAGPKQDELLPVTFKKTTLFLIEHEGEPYVPMRPVVEGMGLNWDSQLDKLTGNEERWSVAEIATVAGDGKRRKMSCIPLRRFFGWLMTISPNKVNPEAKEVVIAYQQECDEVLWHHWNNKFQHRRRDVAPTGTLPDTPPREPLVFPYRDAKGHELQVRVPIRHGQAAGAAVDIAAALGEREPDFLKWYAGIPKRYHGSMPSLSGETMLATLSAEGLAYLFGQRAHRPEVEAFREFWFGTVEPALAARRAGVAAPPRVQPEAAPAAEPEPAEAGPEAAPGASSLSEASLRARFAELALRLWRQRDGGTANAAFPNCGAILARLWPLGAGEWLALGTRNAFARSLGLAHGKSAEHGLARLRGWGLVEARPEEAAWPEQIRLDRAKVRDALREAGLVEKPE